MNLPLILITAHTEKEGTELPDPAISLANRYAEAIAAAGGLPVVLPCLPRPALIRDAISRCDGVLLSGGGDIAPAVYGAELPPEIAETVVPAEGQRDLFELILLDEVFRQAKPLLAICRGHQILNVALGGDLIADIPQQCPGALDHCREPERFQPVHAIAVEPDSLLSRLTETTRMEVNSTHHQAVGRIAPPLRVTARGPDGIVEALELDPAMEHPIPFLLSVQFHPERLYTAHPEHARLFSGFVTHCRRS